MQPVKTVIASAQENAPITAWVGALFGWKTVDFLLATQIIAATLAGLVSLCALILTAPKAIREVRSWFNK